MHTQYTNTHTLAHTCTHIHTYKLTYLELWSIEEARGEECARDASIQDSAPTEEEEEEEEEEREGSGVTTPKFALMGREQLRRSCWVAFFFRLIVVSRSAITSKIHPFASDLALLSAAVASALVVDVSVDVDVDVDAVPINTSLLAMISFLPASCSFFPYRREVEWDETRSE
jgi:hypothetical protein